MSKNFDIEQFPTSPTAVRMLSRISPIYDRSYVGKWIFQVMGLDFDDVRLRFEELRLQAFPETATWGLTYWEQRYGITPSETQTIEERRRAVLVKRYSREPMNPAKVEYIIQTMTGFSAKVTENVADYTFSVEIFSDGGNFDFDAVYSKLKRIKPSHQRMLMYLTTTVGIQIGHKRETYHFPYRMAGTYPQTNIVGVLQDVEIDIETESVAAGFTYPLAGEHVAGTIPQENIVAAIRRVSIENATEGEGVPFPYTFAGPETAGTIPQVNTMAAITGDGLTAAVDTSIATFDFPLCGDNDS